MTKMNASSSKWDEPITQEVLEEAIERGRKRLPVGDQLPAGLQFTAEELAEESEILKAYEEGALERVPDVDTVLKEHLASAGVTLSQLVESGVNLERILPHGASDFVRETMTRLLSTTPRGFTKEEREALDEYDGPIQLGHPRDDVDHDDSELDLD